MDKFVEHADRFYGDHHAAHVGEGVAKSLGSLGLGVYGGVMGLLASPVAGAKRDGLRGFARGTATGLGALVALPAGGVVQGVRQLGSGIANTPESLRVLLLRSDAAEEAAAQAQVPEGATAQTLEAESAQVYQRARDTVLEAAARGEAPPGGCRAGGAGAGGGVWSAGTPGERPKRFAKETELYDALNLNPSALPHEITRNYLRLSQQFQPDKHPGDAPAQQRFQEVGQAYQVLGDPERREKYDRYGMASLDAGFVDPGAFFTLQFGEGKFQPYVGELLVAYAAGRDASKEELDHFQARREKDLALALLTRLEKWLGGQEEEFVSLMLEEARALRLQPFGDRFLQCIGFTYHNTAEVIMGLSSTLGLPGYLRLVGGATQKVKSRWGAIQSALQVRDIQASMVREGKTEMEEQEVLLFLQDIWLISVVDIESTLHKVVEAVVKGTPVSMDTVVPGVGKPTRDEKLRRAKGVMKLGRIFLTVSSSDLQA